MVVGSPLPVKQGRMIKPIVRSYGSMAPCNTSPRLREKYNAVLKPLHY